MSSPIAIAIALLISLWLIYYLGVAALGVLYYVTKGLYIALTWAIDLVYRWELR